MNEWVNSSNWRPPLKAPEMMGPPEPSYKLKIKIEEIDCNGEIE
jgi:hypothetical protein